MAEIIVETTIEMLPPEVVYEVIFPKPCPPPPWDAVFAEKAEKAEKEM